MKPLALAGCLAVLAAGTAHAAESKNNGTTPAGLSDGAHYLPNTQPLTEQGDIASNLVAGVDRFLVRELDGSEEKRARYWHRDYSSSAAYTSSVATNRARLAQIIGVRDSRVHFQSPELEATLDQPSLIYRAK